MYKTAESYVVNQSRSILLVPPKKTMNNRVNSQSDNIPFKIRKFGHFSVFLITPLSSHVAWGDDLWFIIN